MYAFLFSVTDIQAAAYLEPSRVIDQTLMPVENYFTKLTDRRNSSCLYMNLNGSRWLQAIFKFHESVIDHEIDVEIVGKNNDDCAAVRSAGPGLLNHHVSLVASWNVQN